MGKYQARIAADHILGKDVAATAETAGSPRVVFTEPQVAAVGLTLASRRERGIDVRAVDVATAANAAPASSAATPPAPRGSSSTRSAA